MRKITVGSRESKLAVAQAMLVMDCVAAAHPEIQLELVTMKTTGDIILDRSLDQIGGKGLFVKELDQALLDGRIDLSVHSLKDMPMETPEELPIVAFTKRADARDVLILPQGKTELGEGPLGCSSARRGLQLAKLFPGREIKGVRGNVQTRLSKLDRGEYAALVLAKAGLDRLGLSDRISRVFSAEEMLPAAGQGILAVQGRAGEDYSFLDGVGDANATICAQAERSFVAALNGGCSSPVAAYAEVLGDQLKLTGLYYNEETKGWMIGSQTGNMTQAKDLGVRLALRLKEECTA